ncbi:MAG TPA: hypothetical protein VLM05_04900 [Mycobacteriales bacterium]|nr:hypothetical protein [Mycobacteriales bacterium]
MFGASVQSGFSIELAGLLAADQADRTVFTWRSARTLSVVDPRAARAEADYEGRTIPVPMTGGTGRATLRESRIKVDEVRTYDSSGALLGRSVPGSVLRYLPGAG